jgi:hypothetical protein
MGAFEQLIYGALYEVMDAAWKEADAAAHAQAAEKTEE